MGRGLYPLTGAVVMVRPGTIEGKSEYGCWKVSAESGGILGRECINSRPRFIDNGLYSLIQLRLWLTGERGQWLKLPRSVKKVTAANGSS